MGNGRLNRETRKINVRSHSRSNKNTIVNTRRIYTYAKLSGKPHVYVRNIGSIQRISVAENSPNSRHELNLLRVLGTLHNDRRSFGADRFLYAITKCVSQTVCINRSVSLAWSVILTSNTDSVSNSLSVHTFMWR